MIKIYQGNIRTDGSTKIICEDVSMTIININITNPTSISRLNVSKFMTGDGIHEVPLYNFELMDGDVVTDNTPYILYLDSYLQLISDVVGTSYYIEAEIA